MLKEQILPESKVSVFHLARHRQGLQGHGGRVPAPGESRSLWRHGERWGQWLTMGERMVAFMEKDLMMAKLREAHS